MSLKTILQINKYHYRRAGAESYYFDLSDLLRSKGHRVVNFSMKHKENVPSEFSNYFVSNVDISKTQFDLTGLKKAARIIYSFEAKDKIEKLIKDTKPDIAHIHNIYHQISPSILPVLKKRGIPVVMSIHDFKLLSPNYSFLCNGEVCEHRHSYYKEVLHKSIKDSYIASAWCALEAYVHNFLKIYKNNIDLFLAPCEFMKNKFIEYGFDENKIKVLPYTLDLEKYQDLSLPPNSEKYILYLGRLSVEKGIGVLIEAMKKVKGNIKLKIMGDGSMLKSLKLKVKNEKLPNIEFTGFKEGDELKRITAGSLFVVLPVIRYENSPLVIYESMALGKPVIGSRMGGIPELIQDGMTGLLFEAGNADELAGKINFLLNDEEKIKQMSERAKNASKKFGFEEHYRKIMDIYSSIHKGKFTN